MMKKTGILLLLFGLLASPVCPVAALPGASSQEAEDHQVIASAVRGPAEVNLQGVATLTLPRGTAFFPRAAAATIIARMGNVVRPDLLGLVIAGGSDVMVVMEYVADGHVPDGDMKALEARGLLKRLQTETREDRRRREQGLETLHAAGWTEAPHYDSQQHQLFWGVTYQTLDGKGAVMRESINRTAVALGRNSRIGLDLVSEDGGRKTGPAFLAALLSGLRFAPGQRYEDFDARKDKLATYGLSEMIAN